MGLSKDCLEFRRNRDALSSNAGELAGAEQTRLSSHAEACAGCAKWMVEVDDIAAFSAALPQFDVSEQLTQSIMANVAKEAKHRLSPSQVLLVPVAVVCVAAGLTVMPIDSLEGMLSTALSLVVLAALRSLFLAAKTDEFAV